MWPFRRRTRRAEVRTAGVGYADAVLGVYYATAAGGYQRDAIAAVEACVGLYARGMSGARVTPDWAADLVTADWIGAAVRRMGTAGEAVFQVDASEGEVRLLPAVTSRVEGGIAPETWWYELSLAQPVGATVTRWVPRAGVLHFRWAHDPAAAWRGVSPLALAGGTVELARRAEAFMHKEVERGGVQGVFSTPNDLGEEQEDRINAQMNDPANAGGWITLGDDIRPHVIRTFGKVDESVSATHLALTRAIAAAYQVPRALVEDSDGTGAREAYRQLYRSRLYPMARGIEAELRRVLGPEISLSLSPLRAADMQGAARGVASLAAALEKLPEGAMAAREAILASIESSLEG